MTGARVPPNPAASPTPGSGGGEPAGADRGFVHLTVSRGLLGKLVTAGDALSHWLPGATTDEILEAALDLLIERDAERRELARRRAKASWTRSSSGSGSR